MDQNTPAPTPAIETSGFAPYDPTAVKPRVPKQLKWSTIFMRLVYLLLLIGVGIGGYYLGLMQKSHNIFADKALNAASQTAVIPSATISPIATPTPQIITAGGLSSFAKYELTVPGGWVVSRERQDTLQTDKTTLLSLDGKYQLVILQGPMDAGECGYSDLPLDAMGETYGPFVEFVGSENTKFRRAPLDSSVPLKPSVTHYDVCEYKAEYSAFFQFTSFGEIYYTTPPQPDQNMLHEMDMLVSSIEKK